MKTYIGKGIYRSVAFGKVAVFKRQPVSVKRVYIQDKEAEKARVAEAERKALEQLQDIYEKALKDVGKTDAEIFKIHMMMIKDDDYNELITNIIESENVNAEYAVSLTSDNFAEIFNGMKDSYMQARAEDVKDISHRIIANLSGKAEHIPDPWEKVVICADELTPSETVLLDKNKIIAFVIAHGSSYSHAAILAGNMSIPAVVGVGGEFIDQIVDGSEIIVDGFTGEVFVDPDKETVARLSEKQRLFEEEKTFLQDLKGKRNVTVDGREINIFANIGSAEEVNASLANDAGGIGLLRSEFLYMGDKTLPTEEQQYTVYKNILEGMGGRHVVIRTFDIGADKQVRYFDHKSEENPAMGLRGIRIALSCPDIFKTQLRALYRASVYGSLGILFPMIASASELEKVLGICEEVKSELRAQGMVFSESVEIGVMIETPAAAIISDRLAPMVDFFSIGTNDLIQYTLACDRQNSEVEQFIDTHHEAVLRLIEMSVVNAHKCGIHVGICGELAADSELTEAFLRMGIDELSVSPASVLRMRNVVRAIDLSK